MGINITDKDLGFKKFIHDMNKLRVGPHVKVGILLSDGAKKYKKSKATVLKIAISNEFGTERIPARPFIRTTYDENKEKYFNKLKPVATGEITAEKALEMVGLEAVSDTKSLIRKTHSSWVPNASSTIKRKKSNKPLIDTGQLLNSISHKVNKGY